MEARPTRIGIVTSSGTLKNRCGLSSGTVKMTREKAKAVATETATSWPNSIKRAAGKRPCLRAGAFN